MYWSKIDKYINNLIQKKENTKWITDILSNCKYNPDILYQDDKFILVRDIIWDGQTNNKIYMLAIPKNSKLRSIRDLTDLDLPLLKYMKNKIKELLHKKWGLNFNETYCFFSLSSIFLLFTFTCLCNKS